MAMTSFIRDRVDERPPERLVGCGVPHADSTLSVTCGTCKAPEGVQCTKRGVGSHTTRTDKARNKYRGVAFRLFNRLEREALDRDPTGGLWAFQSIPHQCGTLGAHVMTDCTPVADA